MVIWKFELEITDTQQVRMPKGAQILSVANQNGKVCLWAMVNPNDSLESRCIEIIGTGNKVAFGPGVQRSFIGTVVVNPFVWHVFEQR